MCIRDSAMAGARDAALAAGFDGYMSKPIDAITFADTVSSFVKDGRG